MALIFCVTPGCTAPADGRVLLDEVAGSIEYDGKCRAHAVAERADLENRYRSSRVIIAWGSCQRCGGEGTIDGEACPGCRDLTDAGGPFRFGDMVHFQDNIGIYVGPGHLAADGRSWFQIMNLSGPSLDIYEGSSTAWDRCGQPGSPCEHPTTEGAAL